MAEYLIKEETLSGIADAIRAKSGISDVIKVSDFASEIEAITGGGSSEKVLLAEQTFEGFVYDDGYNGYIYNLVPAPYVLIAGETYFVKWDGTVYECVAQDMSAMSAGMIAMGNISALLGSGAGNNEPFIINYVQGANAGGFLAFDTETSHTVKIYQKESSSGGSVEGVRFVTFMSWDGSTELYKRPVADGDDCADPVIRGYISEPTKESTAQYAYTHAGWSASPNGALNSNILKAVTADKTVYANFAAILRYYTVTYYDDDGVTVLKTESLAYGTTPSYKPEKEGYAFDGWTPEFAEVTGNASYTAKWSEKLTFADAAWADIARFAEAGTASNVFAIGDKRVIPVTFLHSNASGTNNNIPITHNVEFEIIGFNHDDLADGSGKAGITLASCNALSLARFCGTSISTSDASPHKVGWLNNPARAIINDVGFNTIDASARQYIKTVTKKSAKVDSSTDLEESADKLFILSAYEFFGSLANGQTTAGQGTQYAHYTDVNNRKKHTMTGDGTISTAYDDHATRSKRTASNTVMVDEKGALNYMSGGAPNAVIAFCI